MFDPVEGVKNIVQVGEPSLVYLVIDMVKWMSLNLNSMIFYTPIRKSILSEDGTVTMVTKYFNNNIKILSDVHVRLSGAKNIFIFQSYVFFIHFFGDTFSVIEKII